MSASKEKLKLLVAMGTRPEIIKLAPVVWAAKARTEVELSVCHSGQHTDLAEPMLDYFQVQPDIELKLRNERPDLPNLFANCISRTTEVLQQVRPDVVVVQGDTATTAAIAMACFLDGTAKVVHVEAGLRTGQLSSPWPEEYNRRIATLSADLHCAPTDMARNKLQLEGVSKSSIEVCGNPVVDALEWTLEREGCEANHEKKQVVITAHRRENFGKPLESVCEALIELSSRFPDHEFYFVTHPNPQAGPTVKRILDGHSRVKLAPAMSYPEFIRLICGSKLVISDSGGVQEEAPTLGTPLLITRDSTERPEVLDVGAAELVGSDQDLILDRASRILENSAVRHNMRVLKNPFGDGMAGERIVRLILDRYASKLNRPAQTQVNRTILSQAQASES